MGIQMIDTRDRPIGEKIQIQLQWWFRISMQTLC